MEKTIFEMLEVKKFNHLPKDINEAIDFFHERGFETDKINADLISSAVTKLNSGDSLSPEEIEQFHNIFDLGDTCGCDSDHRLRANDASEKKVNFSIT